MKKLVGTTAEKLFQGTRENPVDIIIQNLSANDVYYSFSNPSATNNGIKITAGNWTQITCLTKPLFVIASAASSEIRYEVKQWLG